MILVSLAQARLQGLTHYFTGVPCKFGHIAKRQVSNRGCVICLKTKSIRWSKENPERSTEIRKSWDERNKQKTNLRMQEYRKNNPEKYKTAIKKWRIKNSTKYGVYMAKAANDRRSSKLKRTPCWLSDDDHWMMSEAYSLSALRTKLFGFEWHVDHIVPLQGKEVSGLHVPWNLQVIPGVENRTKSNKFLAS